MEYLITVLGIDAAPQGSKSHMGGGRFVESCKRLGPYRDAVRVEANKVCKELISGPIKIEIIFYLSRPLFHFNSKGRVKDSAPKFPITKNKGDIDKLCRSTLDALTLSAINDDSQVVSLEAKKFYIDPDYTMKPKTEIKIKSIA